jgi:16S rRNA (guanine1516-N2)-methyltransferase
MQLITQDNKLTLTDGKLSIAVDFCSPQLLHRTQQSGKELIKKAIGIKKDYRPSVIDATAGLGRDAFMLANFGCDITLLERSHELFLLLQDGITRAQQDKTLTDIIAQMTLIETDSIDYLTQLAEKNYPDVVYLDPMFPERKKSALVKKDMQLLQQLLSDEGDGSELLTVALARAKKRVVVKRPRIAPYLQGQQPQIEFTAKSCRFDVYLLA